MHQASILASKNACDTLKGYFWLYRVGGANSGAQFRGGYWCCHSLHHLLCRDDTPHKICQGIFRITEALKEIILGKGWEALPGRQSQGHLQVWPAQLGEGGANLELYPGKAELTLKRINPNEAPGPHQIFGRLLKTCCSQLSGVLCELFNHSLAEHSVPTIRILYYLSSTQKKQPHLC